MLTIDQKLRFKCLELVLGFESIKTSYRNSCHDARYLYNRIRNKNNQDLYIEIIKLIIKNPLFNEFNIKGLCDLAENIGGYVEEDIIGNEEAIKNVNT